MIGEDCFRKFLIVVNRLQCIVSVNFITDVFDQFDFFITIGHAKFMIGVALYLHAIEIIFG
ncbi:hypothetical protein CXB49_07045 [Chromobacterium sp. ATCC 53434]|nr:hypothetical protein CXB49_07045 [Chromobacterium sp. ATCC 53434]